MLFKEIIGKKRDGRSLNDEEISFFVAGLADGSIPDEQVSALAMAILLQSMTSEETGALTKAMAHSGKVLDWSSAGLGGPVIDKHSTGGVGDKVSFLLAPIAAACGCFVPMISGRGLGHTGGTLDKAGAIPGYDPFPDVDNLKSIVKSVGCAIIGQTDDLAPADRRFYAIRDVTGTVESIPLITASILSKKTAAGLDGLVMDVKTGNGAFMADPDQARALARSLVATAATIGMNTDALITDMNSPLGLTAGNAIEMKECVDYLTGATREPRLYEVTQALCAQMLILGGLEIDIVAARQKTDEALSSGAALEIFAKMVAAQGGPADFIEKVDRYLPTSQFSTPVYSLDDGFVAETDTKAIGNAIIELGGGRRKIDDKLDLSVGFSALSPIGAQVDRTTPLAIVHATNQDDANRAASMLRDAYTISNTAPQHAPVIIDTISST